MDSSVLMERPVSSASESADHRSERSSRHAAMTQRTAARRNPIVAAVDGTESGLTAADAAARLARATAAPLVLVYVRTGPPGWLGRPYFQRRLDSETEAAHRALAAADEVVRSQGVHAESEILEGSPARRISEFAGARDASAVVVGRRPRRFKKSVSRRVVREAARRARPVLVAAGV
jgi:nucleotide-binding universal stress UspA family protein